MGILDLFRRPHKILIFLPRRGGRKLLATTLAKDETEIEEKVLSKLEDFKDDVEIRGAKYVIAIDTKTNTEVKVENPFFDEALAPQPKKEKETGEVSLKEAIEGELLLEVVESVKRIIPTVVSGLTTGVVDIYRDSVKKMLESESRRSELSGIANLIMSLVMLAQNWDKIKKLFEEASPILKKIMSGELPIAPKPEGLPSTTPIPQLPQLPLQPLPQGNPEPTERQKKKQREEVKSGGAETK